MFEKYRFPTNETVYPDGMNEAEWDAHCWKVLHHEPFYMEFTEFPGGPDGPFIDSVPATVSNECTWEHESGAWESNGEGWWRIGPFIGADLASQPQSFPTSDELFSVLADLHLDVHLVDLVQITRVALQTIKAWNAPTDTHE